MRKFLFVCLLCISCINFTCCGGLTSNNINSWDIPDNSRFVPVDNCTIDDGTVNGIDFITYVDLENGTMWLYTRKYYSGYGVTMTKLTDENNNACIYEHLNELRQKYKYNPSTDISEEKAINEEN